MKQNNKKTYGQDAQYCAEQASLAARTGKAAKEEWDLLKEAFAFFHFDIMFKVFVAILLGCCLCVMGGEVMFSYDIYEDIVHKNSDSKILVFVIAAIVIFWGLAASHLMASKISGKIRQFMVGRLVYHGEIPSIAEAKVAREANRHFKTGLMAAFSVVLFVLALSYIRIGALQEINPDGQYTWVDLWLPSILVGLEILTGFYLAFFIQWVSTSSRIRKYKSTYGKNKPICHAQTQWAVASYERAFAEGEKIMVSKELKDALYRFEHRSLACDGYLDPVELENGLGFSENGESPKQDIDKGSSENIPQNA